MKQTNNNQVISINRLTACMIVNNSQVERTGIPMSDTEFCELFNSLPDEINVVVENGADANKQAKTASSYLEQSANSGNTGSGKSMPHYDEVCALLSLNTKGRVVAFRKSVDFIYSGKVVSEDEFNVPENAGQTGKIVYQDILRNQGVFKVYGECRRVTIPNRKVNKRSRVSMGKASLDGAGETSVASFEEAVPIECESLFEPCKANLRSFMCSKTRQEIEDFFDFMLENYGAQKHDTLIYLSGMYKTLTDEEESFMLSLCEEGEVELSQRAKYLECMGKMFGSLTDTATPIEIKTLNGADSVEFDMEDLVLKLVNNTEILKRITDAEIEELKADKCMEVIMQSDGDGKVLANVLSQYISMDIPYLADMGVCGNLTLLYHLLLLINLRISNERVMIVVKRCDVVTFK